MWSSSVVKPNIIKARKYSVLAASLNGDESFCQLDILPTDKKGFQRKEEKGKERIGAQGFV